MLGTLKVRPLVTLLAILRLKVLRIAMHSLCMCCSLNKYTRWACVVSISPRFVYLLIYLCMLIYTYVYVLQHTVTQYCMLRFPCLTKHNNKKNRNTMKKVESESELAVAIFNQSPEESLLRLKAEQWLCTTTKLLFLDLSIKPLWLSSKWQKWKFSSGKHTFKQSRNFQ